jgi:glutamyl-tRNA reductase
VSIVAIGLNHRTAPLELLERMAVDGGRLPKVLDDLVRREHVSEAVVLSTCNRTEVYVAAEKFHGAYHEVRDFFSDLAYLPPEQFSDHLYVHYDADAAAHLFAVAAGLDSAILGETEILGQVRAAWDRAQQEGSAGPSLNLLFRHAVEVGKRARTETGISRNIASVSQAAVAMAERNLGSLEGRSILVLGAGDMGEGMVYGLRGAGVSDIRVANRTFEKASTLADEVGGRAIRLANVADALRDVDVLLTSTGASALMVDQADLARAAAERDRPLLIVDIAVPRDIDPSAAQVDGVTLLDMDDLRVFAEVGVEGRQREVANVQQIIHAELERFVGLASAREVAPLVAALRESAEAVRGRELERFDARLTGLSDEQREAVEALTKGIVNKLLHRPTVELKDAADSPRGERLAEALRDLFDLE